MRAVVKTLNAHAQAWLWLAILATPILALAGGLGFQVTGFFLGMSALLAWLADRTGASYLRSLWPVSLLAFTGWAWASTLWSPYDGAFWGGNAAYLFGLLLPLLLVPLLFLRLPEGGRKPLVWTVIGMGLLGVALLIIDSASHFALSLWGDPVRPGQDPKWRLGQAEMSVGRGQISYAQLLWPIAGLLLVTAKRGWILAVIGFLGLALSAYLNSLSVIIPTLLLAAGFAAIAWRNPRLGLTCAFGFAIASLVFAPLLGFLASIIDTDLMRTLPLSWEHRLRMWAYSWELIGQAPLIGHGFDSARVFNELAFRAPDGRDITVMSMHPHNIGLQIWLETGVIGVIMAVAFLLTLLRAVVKSCQRPARAFAATGLVITIAASGAVTIGLWQHWWWALIIFAASLIILIPDEA